MPVGVMMHRPRIARSGILAPDLDPVLASKGDRTHRFLCKVIAQLQLEMF